MTMTSKVLMDVLSNPRLDRGSVLFLTRKSWGGGDGLTESQRRFAQDYLSLRQAPLQATQHPGKAPFVQRDDKPLSPSEMAWLSRFPSPVDPEKISFEDARALAALARTVNPATHPDDARLVRSVWEPVRDFHDDRAATAAVTNAEAPLPDLPRGAATALADCIESENNQLTRDEAVARASRMVSEAHGMRESRRQQGIELAHRQRMQVDAAVTERMAVSL